MEESNRKTVTVRKTSISVTVTVFLLLFVFSGYKAHATDTTYIRVHFLYGSKAKRAYKYEELPWFGGKLGGHVGIEYDSNKVVNFVPSGSFHVFGKKNERHSQFVIHRTHDFWEIFGSPADSVKQATVIIPITAEQKSLLDTTIYKYRAQTPYDYAFFGMRCGAAAYDLLSTIDVVKPYRYQKTSRKIFYPAKLRKRLFKKAEQYQWTVLRQEGTTRRKWEKH